MIYFREIGKFGDLATLLQWHRNDPPDDFEMNRNNEVFRWQKNRNPFIDHPQLAEYFWGDKNGEPWISPTAATNTVIPSFRIFPNPTKNSFKIDGLSETSEVIIFKQNGEIISTQQVDMTGIVDIQLEDGIYFVKINVGGKSYFQKLVVK